MSTPIINSENPIRGAINEIISGISALNMQPSPKECLCKSNSAECPHHRPDTNHYISETDKWVEHSLEHFRSAIDQLRNQQSERQIYRDVQVKFLESFKDDTEKFKQWLESKREWEEKWHF